MLDWNRHIFFMLGFIYKSILKLDFKNTIESYFWLKIHLTCKSSSSGKMKLTNEEIYGYLGTIFILYFIVKIVKYI